MESLSTDKGVADYPLKNKKWASTSYLSNAYAELSQLVDYALAMGEAVGSSPIFCSIKSIKENSND